MKGRLDLFTLLPHRVQLEGHEGDALAGEELLDPGAEWTKRFGEDDDRVLGDRLVDDLGGILLMAILVANGTHPGQE